MKVRYIQIAGLVGFGSTLAGLAHRQDGSTSVVQKRSTIGHVYMTSPQLALDREQWSTLNDGIRKVVVTC